MTGPGLPWLVLFLSAFVALVLLRERGVDAAQLLIGLRVLHAVRCGKVRLGADVLIRFPLRHFRNLLPVDEDVQKRRQRQQENRADESKGVMIEGGPDAVGVEYKEQIAQNNGAEDCEHLEHTAEPRQERGLGRTGIALVHECDHSSLPFPAASDVPRPGDYYTIFLLPPQGYFQAIPKNEGKKDGRSLYCGKRPIRPLRLFPRRKRSSRRAARVSRNKRCRGKQR